MALEITQTNNGSTLLSNLFRDTRGLSGFTTTVSGNSKAFGTFANASFSNLPAGVVLSTGKVADLAGANLLDGSPSFGGNDASTDLGGFGEVGDSTTLTIDFFADATASKLSFQSIFGSEEFLEFAGNRFDDTFSLTLNGVELATLRNGQPVSVNNLAASPTGPFNSDYINNPVNTGPASSELKLDGYTKTLGWEGNLLQNANNTLVINIKDTGDGIYDSAAFLQGSICSINLEGTSNNDTLVGTACNDTLKGLNSQDLLDGLAGNDLLDGGDGDDTIYGGEGRDTVLGGSGQDLIYGDAGSDKLSGDDGDDRIWGGKGNDTITGGQGQDKLYGDDGDDLLDGGAGDNLLTGGLGKDTFVISKDGKTTIADFQDGQDLLKLTGGLTFTSLTLLQQGSDTVISTKDNQPLAFLTGVNKSLITSADFIV